MKNILFVAHVQSHIMNFHQPFIKYFQEKGYKVYVATKLDKERYSDVNKILPNVEWVDTDFSRSPFSFKIFKALNQLIELMKSINFDLIHVHTPVGGFLGRLAAKITKSGPVLYTAHGFHFYKGAPLSYWLTYYPAEKLAARWTDGLITMNNEDYKIAKNKLPVRGKRVYKVNGVGVDLSKFDANLPKDMEFKRNLGLDDDNFIITVVAELSKRKNQIQIVKAMGEVIKTNKDIKVLLVGEGETRSILENEIKRLRLTNNVLLLGYRKDVQKIMNISDVIGLFSIHEGLPKNLLEGMACGKVIICTNIRGNNDLIEHNCNGLLIDVNNEYQLCEAICKVYNEKRRVMRMEEENIKRIKKYSIDEVVKSMDKIYEEILDEVIKNKSPKVII